MASVSRFLTSRWGPIITGLVAGVLAPVLVKLGNPGNMGISVSCFSRDIAGALGLSSNIRGQYIRPEIIGFVLGALIAALIFREFKPRAGSAPLMRFVLGMFAAFGMLVFIGCPWRAYLRLAGGDWNAIFGILGLVAGIGIGIIFLRRGFSLGRSHPAPKALGWVLPIIMLTLLVLLLVRPQFGTDAETGNPTGPIFFSTEGPASEHAPIIISLVAALVIGFLAQRSRFCTVAAVRNMLWLRDSHLFNGLLAFIGAAFITNLALGQFHPGFVISSAEGQPIAQTNEWWNFAGMAMAGLALTLAGGCPARQLFLSGEGDADAAMFVIGMTIGAGFAQNYSIASCLCLEDNTMGAFGWAAVITGLVICIIVGLVMREKEA
jgi:YedE family putative selenium metabolism protein